MATTLTKYRVFCNDEGAVFDTDFLSGAPRCPNNSGHTLDSSKTTVLTTFSTAMTMIDQGALGTQGLYRIKGNIIDIPAGIPGSVSIHDIVIRTFPTVTIKGCILPTAENIGDIFSIYTKPDTTIGTLAEEVTAGCSGITMVSVANVRLGGYLKLVNGSTTIDLDECKTITGNYVLCGSTTDTTYPIGTLVKQSITNIRYYPIVNTIPTEFGRLSGQLVPSGINSRLSYINNNGLAKKFHIAFETFY